MAESKPFLLGKMTWQEAEALFKETDIAIVPVGSTEQHGPALPLDNDAFLAEQFAHAVAERLWPKVKTVITPLVSYGVSPHHMSFSGTITLRHETFIDLIVDIGMSLSKHGAKKIIVMNSHGGNTPSLSIALRRLHDAGLWCVGIEWWKIASDAVKEAFEPPHFHACALETSVTWALGQRVLVDKLIDEPGREPIPDFTKATMFPEPPNFSPAFDMTDYTSSGMIGNATQADAERGKKVATIAIERIVAFIERVALMPAQQ